jgi:hypothetical protein
MVCSPPNPSGGAEPSIRIGTSLPASFAAEASSITKSERTEWRDHTTMTLSAFVSSSWMAWR